MNKFKTRWEIQHNWQLIFPFLGIIGLIYSSYKLSFVFVKEAPIYITVLLTLVISFILLKLTLFIFKKLEKRWGLTYKWEMIRVFLVFAITGTSSLYIGKPIIEFIGIQQELLNPFLYWLLFIFVSLLFYQILLIGFGWLFGQGDFFWNIVKKMLKRIGFSSFIKDDE